MPKIVEGETCFECLAVDDYCHVYTTETWCKNKIKDWLEKFPDECRNFKIQDESWSIEIPARCMRSFSFRKKSSRTFSDEERAKIKERLANSRGKRKKKAE